MLRHVEKWLFWFVIGGAFGTYLLGLLLTLLVNSRLYRTLANYPPWLHLPLIVLLFVILLRPASHAWKRYRRNLASTRRPFTPVEGIIAFSVGTALAGVFNGSLVSYATRLTGQGFQVAVLWAVTAIVFVIAVVLTSRIQPDSEDTTTPPLPPLLDAPIVLDSQDTLGRKPFVEGLLRQIKAFPFDESFVFGLNGTWGSGKTSVLNLLKTRLRREKGVITVEFNPWYFASVEALVHNFYSAIAAEINSRFFYPNLPVIARKYARVIAPTINRYGLQTLLEKPDAQEAKRRIEEYIVQTGHRIVVLIDDLDRLQTADLLLIFKMVRLTATFKNTVFLLAYDESQITDRLRRADLSKDFLDKIVQSPIDLPAVDQYEVDRFLLYSDSEHKSQLDVFFDMLALDGRRRAEFDKEVLAFYPRDVRPFFSTLRNAKRFLNSFTTRLPAVIHEVHLLDFFLLEVLRVFANHIFRDIWENRYFYIPGWGMKVMQDSPFSFLMDADKKEERIRSHIDALLQGDEHASNLLEILKKLLFVEVKNAYGPGKTNHDNMAATYRAQKRLTHLESFEKYFLLAVRKGTLPDAAIEATLESWKTAARPRDAMLETLNEHQQRGTITEFLEKLLVFIERLEAHLCEPLLDAIGTYYNELSDEGLPSQRDRASSVILYTLDDRVPSADRRQLFEKVLVTMPGIDVAVELLATVSNPQTTGFYNLKTAVDTPAAQELLGQRFREEFVQPANDIFQTSSRPTYVLHKVARYGPEWREIVDHYTLQLCEHNPAYVGQLVASYYTRWAEDMSRFDFDGLASTYDVHRLAEIIRKEASRTWSDVKQEEAIERFQRALEQKKTTAQPPSAEQAQKADLTNDSTNK